MQELSTRAGVEVPVGVDQQMMTCRAMVLCTTVDLPAKAKLLNFTQFNGYYGCSVCLHEGRRVPSGAGTTHAYEYQVNPAPLRTHTEYVLGKRALRTQTVKLSNKCIKCV